MRITIDLRRDEYDRLQRLALAERRPMRDQAAVLIADGLKGAPVPSVTAEREAVPA